MIRILSVPPLVCMLRVPVCLSVVSLCDELTLTVSWEVNGRKKKRNTDFLAA